jgi:hypothetical protein
MTPSARQWIEIWLVVQGRQRVNALRPDFDARPSEGAAAVDAPCLLAVASAVAVATAAILIARQEDEPAPVRCD